LSVTSAFLLVAVWSDIRTEKVPNILILSGILAGIFLQCCSGFPGGVSDMIFGMVLPILICWILFRVRGLGAGDVKLLCLIGCLNGVQLMLLCFCLSVIIAAVYAAIYLLYRHQMLTAMRDVCFWFREMSQEKKILPYAGSEDPSRRMHFSAALFYGYLLAYLGVAICRNIT